MAEEENVDTQNVTTEAVETVQGNQNEVTTKEAKNTFIDGGVENKVAPADWPEDWRTKLAGEDEKFLKQLERMSSPNDVAKAYRNLEKKQGASKFELPEKPSEEDVARYRKENGIPETPEGYLEKVKLTDGLVIGEQDRPYVDAFLKDMHGKNFSPSVVNEVLNSYFQMQENSVAEIQANEKLSQSEVIEKLRSEWGPEYKHNGVVIDKYLDELPDEIGDMIRNGRDASGKAFRHNASFANWLLSVAKEADPAGSILHTSGTAGVSIGERIEQIQKIIRDEPERYRKGEEGKRLQDELQKLVTARDKNKGRAA